jgi:putative nucleotidyltransferase with HDIG domain
MIASAPIDLESLVDTELPPLPGVALRVAALAHDLDSSARKIADAIGYDPILAARILRAANSPLYYFQKTVTALPMAVSALGNQSIYSLVVMSATADAFRKGRRSELETRLWEHSVAVALGARELTLMLRLRGIEEAFLCGLLHDFGKLMMLRHEPETYTSLLNGASEGDLVTGELELFGYTHAQVGALATKRWNLPDEVSQTIYYHHQPGQSEHGNLMARIVDVADALAYSIGLGDQRMDDSLAESESVIALRLTEAQLEGVVDKIKSSSSEAFKMFT